MTQDLGTGVFAIAIAGTLATGFLIGTLHAWLITVVGLPPFVATLASLVGLRSLSRVFVQEVTASLTKTGKTTQIYVNDEAFSRLGTTWWVPLAVFLVLSFLAWLLIHTVHRVRTVDVERIPAEGAAVLVCNHVSYVDAIVIGATAPRPIRFVMDHRIFKLPLLGWIFRTARAIRRLRSSGVVGASR